MCHGDPCKDLENEETGTFENAEIIKIPQNNRTMILS